MAGYSLLALLLFHRCGEDFPSLTENGSILVPVSFPVQRLVAFINTSHCKAKQLKSEYERSVTFQLLFGTYSCKLPVQICPSVLSILPGIHIVGT